MVYIDSEILKLFPLFLLSFTSSRNSLKSVGLKLKLKISILQIFFFHIYVPVIVSIKLLCGLLVVVIITRIAET